MVLPPEMNKAARKGNLAAIQEWFATDTRDPDDRIPGGDSLLHIASRHGQCDIIRLLLERGADVNATDSPSRTFAPANETPLHTAALNGQCDAAVLLLDRGARVNFASAAGETPLTYAALSRSRDMIRLLLDRGADLDARNDLGRTAEANARIVAVGALLADVRVAGGWGSYVRVPRTRLLCLRALCARGRASTDDALLRRLFPARAAADDAPVARELPKEVFWLVVAFWRSARDARRSVSDARGAATGDVAS